MWTNSVHMKTVTVRDLRNHFSKVEAWLGEGLQVRVEKRGEPVAVISPISAQEKVGVPKIDWAARRKAIWGDRVFSEQEVREMREYELEGEEG